MDDGSIGEILRTKRDERSLGLQDVHEATKITPQNLAALEENRFDAFPNKVYARAFLRDYANFLDLDSASLLARYEEEWGVAREVEPVRHVRRVAWRAIAYTLAVIVVLGGAGAGSYFWWTGCEQQRRASHVAQGRETPPAREGSILPPQPVVPRPHQPQPQPARPEPAPPMPAPVPQPAGEERITLDVFALRGVWVRVKCDGKRVYEGIMPKGSSKAFEAKDSINIRAGMAGAVQIKLDGVPQAPLGTLRTPGEKTYRREHPDPGTAAPAPPPSF